MSLRWVEARDFSEISPELCASMTTTDASDPNKPLKEHPRDTDTSDPTSAQCQPSGLSSSLAYLWVAAHLLFLINLKQSNSVLKAPSWWNLHKSPQSRWHNAHLQIRPRLKEVK